MDETRTNSWLRLHARRIVVALCVAAIFVDLGMDTLLGHPFYLGTGQVAVIVFAALLLAGVLLGRRLLVIYAGLSLVASSVVVLCIAAELLSYVIPTLVSDATAPSPYFEQHDWANELLMSQGQSGATLHYEPYTVARQGPFASRLVNIDASGVRTTPQSTCTAGAFRIFLFGGSTMWGYDVPDWGTIPAYLNAVLKQHATRDICVVNYGEWDWVASQEAVQFARLLSEGNIPDAVVFYDGINDVFPPLQAGGRIGKHLDLSLYRARLGGGEMSYVRSVMLRSNLARLVRNQVVAWRERAKPTPASAHDADVEPIVAAYERTHRVIASLAEQYGIPYMFFWQPVSYARAKPLAEGEVPECLAASPDQRRLFQRVYQRISLSADSLTHFRDISRLFDGDTSLVFVDAEHITPEGNRRVAAEMAAWLVRDSSWSPALGVKNLPPVAAPTETAAARSCEARLSTTNR